MGIEDALGRVLAADVVAAVTLPPWDNSAMDGYAILAGDVKAASEDAPARLEVVGEVPAGGIADRLVERGSAIRIATGAPIPEGADAVVPVEATTPIDAAGVAGARGRDAAGPLPAAILVHDPGRAGAHVRRRGSDLDEGATILTSGSAMTPAAVALAAGAGLASVSVRRRPRVAVLATGTRSGSREPTSVTPASRMPTARAPGACRGCRSGGDRPRDRPGRPRRRDGPAPCRARRRRRRDRRRRRRVGRAVRRRQAGVRSGRADRPLAGRGPAGQAVRVRDGTASGRQSDAAVRAARQPRVELRHVRALRPPRDPRALRPPRSATVPSIERCSSRRSAPPRTAGRSSAQPPSETPTAGRNGTSSVASASGCHTARRGRGATCSPRWPPRMPSPSCARRSRSTPPATRSICGGSTRRDLGGPPSDMHAPGCRIMAATWSEPRPGPAHAERRRLTHVDRAGRPRMVDVSAKPVDSAPGRRGGVRRALGGDAEPRDRRAGRRATSCRGGARRRDGRQADVAS